jgi:hypothetical protein
MIIHPAITIGKDGEPEIDLDLLKESANSDSQDLDSALARMILIAYEAGFQMGIAEASQANMRAQMLLHCTGGNA